MQSLQFPMWRKHSCLPRSHRRKHFSSLPGCSCDWCELNLDSELAEFSGDSTLTASDGLWVQVQGAALLILHSFMENLPDQSTQTMRHRPDGLLRPFLGSQPTIETLEKAVLGMSRRMRGLTEQAPHLPIALGGAIAGNCAPALLLARTNTNP